MDTNTTPIHRLLCFAHRGEAKAFFQEYSWSPWKDQESLYSLKNPNSEKLSLVLMGEGSESTFIHLTRAITILMSSYPKDEFEIINFGVCGALKDSPINFKVNDVAEITTCYAQNQFKSYSPREKETPFITSSIISTNARVLTREQSLELSHFAPLVDREAWAVGRVCRELKVPFRVLKVVSDFADGDICARVKEDTEVWSDSLLRAFLRIKEANDIKENQVSLKESLPGLHITISQERKLNQLIKALELKGHDLSKALKAIDYEKLMQTEIRPKEKTKRLTGLLQELLNPLEKELRQRLAKNTDSLQKAGFQVSFDQGLEQERVNLSVSLESEIQINKLITALESYDLLELRNILRGSSKDQSGDQNV